MSEERAQQIVEEVGRAVHAAMIDVRDIQDEMRREIERRLQEFRTLHSTYVHPTRSMQTSSR